MPTGTTTAPADDRTRWLEPLAGSGPEHDAAVQELHELLLRAAGHEVRRRSGAMGLHLGSSDVQVLVEQAAGDALVAVLARLDDFEGRSRFTTWAYKFAIHIAGVAVRHAAWQSRSVPSPADALERLARSAPGPDASTEQSELLRAILDAIEQLTPRQRDVLVSLAIDGVPIDVLAERLGSTRGALYKSLHDARQAVRRQLHAGGLIEAATSEVLDA
jgi:RNA polymerase sigma-70 factor (ECF subfamily)